MGDHHPIQGGPARATARARRSLLVVAILRAVVALGTTAPTHADTIFWINGSGDDAGSPSIGVLNPLGGTGYIWGRPDGDETLLNLNLNLDSASVSLIGVSVVNPVINARPCFECGPLVRYEFETTAIVAADAVTGLGGFTITNTRRIGVGIGHLTGSDAVPGYSLDPEYDAANNAFLIASFDYSTAGDVSSAGIWLQIGAKGLNSPRRPPTASPWFHGMEDPKTSEGAWWARGGFERLPDGG